jgi:hypothetical protein
LPTADNESFRALPLYAKGDAQRVLGGLVLPSKHAGRLASDVLRALAERLEHEEGGDTEVQTQPDASGDA